MILYLIQYQFYKLNWPLLPRIYFVLLLQFFIVFACVETIQEWVVFFLWLLVTTKYIGRCIICVYIVIYITCIYVHYSWYWVCAHIPLFSRISCLWTIYVPMRPHSQFVCQCIESRYVLWFCQVYCTLCTITWKYIARCTKLKLAIALVSSSSSEWLPFYSDICLAPCVNELANSVIDLYSRFSN